MSKWKNVFDEETDVPQSTQKSKHKYQHTDFTKSFKSQELQNEVTVDI